MVALIRAEIGAFRRILGHTTITSPLQKRVIFTISHNTYL